MLTRLVRRVPGRLALVPMVLLLLPGRPARAAPPAPGTPPNIVLILTDDQRFDTLSAMPITVTRLAAEGVVFDNTLVTLPSCGPTRASLYSGGYLAKNTGVTTNDVVPGSGGFEKFVETDSLPLRLQRAGYRTELIGKYINGWKAPYIPRGWTEFAETAGSHFTVGSTTENPGTGTTVDFTGLREDAQRDRIIQFIDQNLPSGAPLFIVFGTTECHYPSVPAPQDANLFSDFVYRGRGYVPGSYTASKFSSVAEEDEFHRDQLRSLQSVDRIVGAIYDRFAAAGQLDRTVFIFSSDNGYMWGEHGLFEKSEPFEESIRVPLVVRAPGTAQRLDQHMVAMNLDVPATILDFAGLPNTGDGMSLRPLLADPNAPWRQEVLIEFYDWTWAGIRTRDDATGQEWKYFEKVYEPGVRHLYDLKADPYELSDLGADPAHQTMVNDFSTRLAGMEGIASLYFHTNAGLVYNLPFSIDLGVQGGTPPISWRIVDGTLPLGLSLDPKTGRISGIPLERLGNHVIRYEITGSRFLPQPSRFESYVGQIAFSIISKDRDRDGVNDAVDNCPMVANPSQLDSDLDGVGDACTACSDGIDNDGDGRVDFDGGASFNGGVPLTEPDPGCLAAAVPHDGTSERWSKLPCDDGIDNDGDGLVDTADPGCAGSPFGIENPQCADGIDNDGDGFIDYDGTPPDPQCTGPAGKESSSCGVGVELLVLAVPYLVWRRRRPSGPRRAARRAAS